MTNKVSGGIKKFGHDSAQLGQVDPLRVGKVLFVRDTMTYKTSGGIRKFACYGSPLVLMLFI